MFERYPEPSVRALFVAKAAALAAGAQSIDVEHLLVGALGSWPDAGIRCEEVVRAVGLSMPSELPGPGSPEMPFSGVVQRVLNGAMALADRLGQHRIRPEHLLLALLDDSYSVASEILQQAAVEREELLRSAAEGALLDDGPLQYRSRLEIKVSSQ
jgi:ATP-dependent Clp protease ATP-binding subunit ClpC